MVAVLMALLLAAGPETDLDQYLAEAVDSHPALEQRHAEWRASLARIPQVTSLDDPVFSYAYFIESETKHMRFAIAQKFPWFGTLTARGNKAEAAANAALSRLHAARDTLVYRVKRAYYEYALLAERLEIVLAQADVLDYVEDIVDGKLALGLATDDELLRVSIEKTKLDDRHAGLEQLRPALSQRLAAAIGRQPQETLPWPDETDMPPEPPPPSNIPARIRQANPNLQAIEHRIAALDREEELAHKRGLPGFTLGLAYAPMQNRNSMRGAVNGDTLTLPGGNREDDLMVSLSVNVPLWRKRIRGGIEEARRRRSAAGQEQQALFLELESAAEMAHYDMEDAARRYRLFQDSLIPQAQMNFDSLQEKYAADAAGKTFIDILDAVRQLLDFQLEAARARTRWQQANAQLEMLMGGAGQEAAQAE
ncbi:MAG: TolC family protein [Candidatus Hydrogenedentota bacterium]